MQQPAYGMPASGRAQFALAPFRNPISARICPHRKTESPNLPRRGLEEGGDEVVGGRLGVGLDREGDGHDAFLEVKGN